MTKLASGVDLYDRVLGVALADRELEQQGVAAPAHGGAIARFLVAAPGRLHSVGGLEEARAMPGVDDVQVFVPPGGQVLPLTDSAKRAAYVLAHGSSRKEAEQRASEALQGIRIETNDGRQAEVRG